LQNRTPSCVDDALRWLDRAEEARMVAEQLIDPRAKEVVLQVAEGYERRARTAAARAKAGEASVLGQATLTL
jgi:hypothetical protein